MRAFTSSTAAVPISGELSYPASTRTHLLATENGRGLRVREWGPPSGFPVIHHHRTLESSLSVPGGWWAPHRLGVRLITFDRPGYGSSPRVPGRQVAQGAAWTKAVVDFLAIERFSLLGMSGGAPHAAAAAASFGERVHKLCIIGGIGPDELPGFDPADGAGPETRLEIACARTGESQLQAFVSERLQGRNADQERVRLSSKRASEVGGWHVESEAQASRAETLRQGGTGWIDDDLAMFYRQWGCDLAGITAQTLLLYGAQDELVPAHHGDAYRLALGHGQLIKASGGEETLRQAELDALEWLVDPGEEPARVLG